MSTPLIGEIKMFAGNFAPQGWALCNGQLLAISQNTALFSILGTTYGGNGTSNFALPDLRSRVPVHMGQGVGLSSYIIGQSAGAESVSLTISTLPAHFHPLVCVGSGGNIASPIGTYPAIESTGTSMNYSSLPPTGQMNTNTVGSAGGGLPFSIVQPYLTVTFIIALEGVFPARN
jgi:microcystin-dependent protein